MDANNPFIATDLTPPINRKTGVRWWLIISILCTPFLLLTLGVFLFRIGFTIREAGGRKAMSVEIQKLAEEGNTIDNETTDLRYRNRTSVENQERWLNLFASLETQEFENAVKGIPRFDPKIDDDQAFKSAASSDWKYAAASESLVSQFHDSIGEIRQLAASPTPVQFPILFQSTETLLPEVQNIRQLTRLVFVDCMVALHRKDNHRATEDIVTLFNLGDHADAVPFVVSRLVGIATRRLALESLQACIQVDLLNDDQLGQIDGKLKGYCDIGNRWRLDISEELGLHLPVFTNPSIAMNSKRPLPARGHDAVYYIDLMRRAMVLDTEDWSAFYSSALELDSELSAPKGVSIQSADRILSNVLAPAFGAIAASKINDAQMHRQARLAILIRMHAHRIKDLPASLRDLSSETAQLHPVGSQSFGYQLESDKAVLWGFDWSNTIRQTPSTPPSAATGEPNWEQNSRLVWTFDRLRN